MVQSLQLWGATGRDSLPTSSLKGFKERGNSKTYQDGNLTVSAWQDSKVIVVVATNSNPTIQEQVMRKKRDDAGKVSPVTGQEHGCS